MPSGSAEAAAVLLRQLPSDLLHAIADGSGGRVALVIGAGCSTEPPTCLPLTSVCAENAHRKLLVDGILHDGDCSNPSDLSCVADVVFAAKESQVELIKRLPVDDFKSASPNQGHLLAAALLLENSLRCVLTLNFDLAMSNAIAFLGHGDVAIIAGPEDYGSLRTTNIIYLHRSAYARPDDWILRSTQLRDDWRVGWEHVAAYMVLAAPLTVFAGLGSPAGVLTENVKDIRSRLGDHVKAYQVDVVEPGHCAFFAALSLPTECYLQMGWIEFMEALSSRVLEEQRAQLHRECIALAHAEGWSISPAALALVTQTIVKLGLLGLGYLRSRWMLANDRYLPARATQLPLLADLVLVVELIHRFSGADVQFQDDGFVTFFVAENVLTVIRCVSGRGTRRWSSLEAELSPHRKRWLARRPRPALIIASGVVGSPPDSSPMPANVTGEDKAHDLIRGDSFLKIVSADALRASANPIKEFLS
jgi:hypothetical protein